MLREKHLLHFLKNHVSLSDSIIIADWKNVTGPDSDYKYEYLSLNLMDRMSSQDILKMC